MDMDKFWDTVASFDLYITLFMGLPGFSLTFEIFKKYPSNSITQKTVQVALA